MCIHLPLSPSLYPDKCGIVKFTSFFQLSITFIYLIILRQQGLLELFFKVSELNTFQFCHI